MSQLIPVKLSKFDNQPWGFRLQGGKDFGVPLSIQKVTGGSLSEQAGLRAGDFVVKINNQDVFHLRHKDAQDVIVRAGNNFEMVIQRGAGTTVWQPQVTPIGNVQPEKTMPPVVQPVTQTSLAANVPAAKPIGTAHNMTPRPFAPNKQEVAPELNGPDTVKAIVNKQYNSPVGMYSEESIAETLSAQTEVLASGVLGVNFKKNERQYNSDKSEVFKMVQDLDKEPRSPVPPEEEFRSQPAIGGMRPVKSPEARPPPQVIPQTQQQPTQGSQNICAECERLIVGVFVRIKDKNLHVECFKCAICGTSLKNVGYYNVNNKLYCDVHARQVARQQPNDSVSSSEPPKPAPFAGPAAAPPPTAAPLSPYGPGSNISSYASNIAPQPFNANRLLRKSPTSVVGPRGFKAGPGGGTSSYSSMTKSSSSVRTESSSLIKTTGTKLVWPPPKPDEFDLTTPGPTATPLYVAPIEQNPPFPSQQSPFSSSSAAQLSPLPTFPSLPPLPQMSPTKLPQLSPTKLPQLSPTKLPQLSPTKPIAPQYSPVAPPVAPQFSPAPPSAAPQFSPKAPPSAPAVPPPIIPAGGLGGPRSLPGATVAGAIAPRRGKGQLKQQVPGSRIPVCASCQKQIRGPFITALGKTWCPDHFHCVNAQCNRALQDCGFVEEQGQLYCEYCWETYLAPVCDKCTKRIKGDCLNAIGKHFHPECFACSYCSKLFGNNPFFIEDGLPYCETDWNELFTTKCILCGYPIEAGDRWVEALNNNYHSQCFNCTMCKKNLEGQSFFAKGGRPFCKAHAR